MTAVELRPTNPDDLEAIASFDDDWTREPGRAKYVERSIETGQATSILRNGEVIGHEFFHRAFLSLLYIAEAHRGRGYGRKVLRHLKAEAVEPFFTSTNLSNSPMLHLLRAENFVDSGVIYNLDERDPEIVFYWKKSP